MFQLSIIIPVYNAAGFIDKCFDNVTKHAPAGTEIIFVNDGSKDGSLEKLETVAANRPDIKVISKPNGGAASARNAGIKQASGRYIAFVDADDTIDLEALSELLTFSIDNELEICAYGYNYITSNGTVVNNSLKHPIAYGVIDSGLSFLWQGYQPSSICVFLIDRNFIVHNQLLFVEGITHEDVEISLRYFLKARKVYFSEKVIYNYYQNEGSVTNQVTQQKKERYLLDEAEVAFLMKQNLKAYTAPKEITVIQKNYNSVTWNLLYQMLKDKAIYDKSFRRQIINILKEKKVYPIRGPLKTRFQYVSRIFMNFEFVLMRF